MINKTGFVNIIKPTGMTSSDVVLAVKKILKTKKVGHLGTLDPAASGVLPIAVGKATKFFDYFLNKDKEYYAVVKFGVETDTLDSFGKIINSNDKITLDGQLLNVLNKFIGKIKQIPPKYSAIKINGKKAYELARANIDFEIKSRDVEIFNIDLINKLEENLYLFKVNCSAGTYIRTLFSDIAKELNTISVVTAIIRTKSGRFNNYNSITLDELKNNEQILSIKQVFNNLSIIDVQEEIAKKLINGVKITKAELKLLNNDKNNEFFITYKNNLIGMYKETENNIIPIVYLYEGVYND